MGDSEETSKPDIPTWQQTQQAPPPPAENEGDSKTGPDAPAEATLEQARKFLQDEEVRKSSRERKAEFLKAKGIPQDSIDKLLSEEDSQLVETQAGVQSSSACCIDLC